MKNKKDKKITSHEIRTENGYTLEQEQQILKETEEALSQHIKRDKNTKFRYF